MKEYWWVSVAGADCEPAVLVMENGVYLVYTIGCPDAFQLNDRGCPITLVDEMEVPLTPKQERAQRNRELRELRANQLHGYRRFD